MDVYAPVSREIEYILWQNLSVSDYDDDVGSYGADDVHCFARPQRLRLKYRDAAVMLLELEKRENAEGIEKVYYYLNDARTYYLATTDGNKPKVRPFGTILLDDGKLYIQTGKSKDVSKQIGENPFVEICACMNDGTWVRIDAELVEDDSHEIKEKMLDKMPSLKAMYSADDDNMQMFWLKDATAVFSSFTAEPETISF